MRIGPHKHRCSRCGTPTECSGDIEQNFDGHPEWICREFHTLANYEFTPIDHFLCEGCAELVDHCDDEPDDNEGEAVA